MQNVCGSRGPYASRGGKENLKVIIWQLAKLPKKKNHVVIKPYAPMSQEYRDVFLCKKFMILKKFMVLLKSVFVIVLRDYTNQHLYRFRRNQISQ